VVLGAGAGAVAVEEAGVVIGAGAEAGVVSGAGILTGMTSGVGAGAAAGAGDVLGAVGVSLAEGSISLVTFSEGLLFAGFGVGFSPELATDSLTMLCPIVSPVTGHTEG